MFQKEFFHIHKSDGYQWANWWEEKKKSSTAIVWKKKQKKSSLTKLFYQVVTGMYNRRENKRKTVHETAHESYLAKRNKTKLNNGNTGCYIQFLSSKYKPHMRMFLPQSKNKTKQKLRLFPSTKMSFLQMCTWSVRVFPFLSVCRGEVWNRRLDEEKEKFILECGPGLVAGTRPNWMKPNLDPWLTLDPPLPPPPNPLFSPPSIRFLPEATGGPVSYMATLATCSSSLAIRRSWRMTRSLSDLNSRSTSSSLSSIFWSKTEREVSFTKYLTCFPDNCSETKMFVCDSRLFNRLQKQTLLLFLGK